MVDAIDHGGWFTPKGTGGLKRATQDKLRESISAADFGALGDNSGLKVSQWLTGGSHSRGAADLTQLRAMTGIADLELTDTIDWAAITMALKAAGERPVLLTGAAPYHRISRAIVIEQGGIMGLPGTKSGAISPVSNTFNQTHNLIHLKPSGTRIVLKDLYLVGGKNTIYGDGGGTLNRLMDDNSIIENIQLSGPGNGFFFDGLQAIGCRFHKIRVEGCGGHGFWFRGNALLNAAQIVNCRAATCKKTGMFFENLSDQSDMTAVEISGATAEYNYGPGVHFRGYNATMITPHFEGNDQDRSGDGPDLLLSSSGAPSSSRVHARVAVIGGYWSGPLHPQGWRASGSPDGTQMLVLVMPTIRGGVVNKRNLQLTVIPDGAVSVV